MKVTGFSIIELMVVIAIVAVLSSAALVSYKRFIADAKVSSVIQTLDGFKPKISEYYLRTNSWAAMANDVLPGSSTIDPQLPDNAKIANVNLSTINFASANNPCASIASGTVTVGQVLAYLDSTAFPSGYITSTSFVQLLQGVTGRGVVVSAIAKSINGVGTEYIGFGKPATITGSGTVDFMAAVCATYP